MSRVYVFSPFLVDDLCINFAYHRDMVTLIHSDRDLLGLKFEVGDRLLGVNDARMAGVVARRLAMSRVKLGYAGYVVADD